MQANLGLNINENLYNDISIFLNPITEALLFKILKIHEVDVLELFLAQSLPIASLKIPNIQPFLDIITRDTEILRVSKNSIVSSVLIVIFNKISADLTNLKPEIKSYIFAEDTDLVNSITSLFNAKAADIATDIKSITDSETT